MKSRLQQLLWRCALAVAGGLISSLAFPRENIWPLIFISVTLLLIAIHQQKFRSALLVGFVGGLAFYLSQIEWLSLYLGPVPWLALSVLEAIIFALGMAATALVWNRLSKLAVQQIYKDGIAALAIATLFTSREWVSITLPYGGFPWSRLSQTQSDSPLGEWVYLGGLALLTWIIALVSALLAISFLNKFRKSTLVLTTGIAVTAFLVPGLLVIPVSADAGTLTIAGVQGNADAGLFANTKRGQILQNHLDATRLLNPNQKPDVVIWPENASDLSPFSDASANRAITNLVNDELKVPLIFGTITKRGDQLYNSSIIWRPGVGATDWYDKKRPVPFAEYVPDRDFWYQLAPDLIGLVSRGYSFGERDGIFELNENRLGALICFEIAIDDIGRNLVAEGAQVIISQTNNADFGFSDETFQQAAFARLRAIETGRTVVNVSTVGVSAIYAADGKVIQQVPTFEPAVLEQEIALSNKITPAMTLGPILELWFNLVAIFLVGFATTDALRRRIGER